MKRCAGVLCALGLVAGAFAAAPAAALPPGPGDAVCRSATRRSRVRRAAGPATPTRARRASTRSARPPITTPPAARRSRAATARGRPRSTSAAASCPRTSRAPARARTRRRRAPATSSPAWTSTATAPAARDRRSRCSSTRARAASSWSSSSSARTTSASRASSRPASPTGSPRRRGGRTTAATTRAWRACSRRRTSRSSRQPSRARSRTSRHAMANAGYQPGDYRLVAQTYSSPIPGGGGFRYKESGFTRQTIGGCGVWNRDADWANATMVATLNGVVKRAAQTRRHRRARHPGRARRPPAVREHGRPSWRRPGSRTGPRRARQTARSGSARSAP